MEQFTTLFLTTLLIFLMHKFFFSGVGQAVRWKENKNKTRRFKNGKIDKIPKITESTY